MSYGNSCAKLGIYYIENENIKLGREYIKKACEVKHKWRTCKHTNKQWDQAMETIKIKNISINTALFSNTIKREIIQTKRKIMLIFISV